MVREEEIVETLMGGVHGGFWVEFNVLVILAAVLWLASKIQGEGGWEDDSGGFSTGMYG